jgi:tetratricopeptide (TPR) repeat protein
LLPTRANHPHGQHQVMPVDEAGQLHEQLAVYRMRLADAATDLGSALGQRGEYAEAEALLRQAIAAYESCCGPDDVRLAAPLTALAAACAARGRPGEAERLCRLALQIIHTRALERS